MKYGCCIVETRPLHNLLEIIQEKHLNFIQKDWGLTMFLSEANKHLVKPYMFAREVNIHILPSETMSGAEYNRLLTSVEFWDKLPYDKVLIFQHDSELLREGVEDFAGWDFIGAHDPRPGCEGMMNGGLSFRGVAKCREVCEAFPYDGQRNEDWHFCAFMPEITANFPSAPMNIRPFSIEQKFLTNSVGAHAIDKWLTPEQCEQIRNQYK